jgi:formylglycine-generating enzyme required for sulfatase activity
MRSKLAITSLLSAALLLCARATAHAITLDLVPIGNPGNAADIRFDPQGFGAVDYTYWIGKYEVTNGQYREFLNAKATIGDPHGLYNPAMADLLAGIERIGSGTPEDPWVYHPLSGEPSFDDRPVNFVGFWDIARFANWLHNGQGDADTETGAYTGIGDEATFARLPGARYFIPTENEWYKAAYYDPDKNGDPGYWLFPTRSDTRPSNDAPPGADMENGSANYSSATPIAVGAYSARPSVSAYGTFDQGGNVWEWNETFVIDDYFGLRGGAFANIYGLEASHRDSYPAFFENPIMGFRIAAAVPEPSTLALVLTAAAYAAFRRRSRNKKA